MKKINLLISLFILIWGVIGNAGAALGTFDDRITGETKYGFESNGDPINDVILSTNDSLGVLSNFPEDHIGPNFLDTTSYAAFGFISDLDRFVIDDFKDTYETAGNNPVPEPATMLLLGIGLICLGGAGRKRVLKR